METPHGASNRPSIRWSRRALARALHAACMAVLALCAGSCSDGDAGAAASAGAWVLGSIGRQPGQFSKPRAVVVSSRDELVVVDRTGRIQVFDLDRHAFKTKWLLPDFSNGTPTGITLDPADDTLWIADTHYQRILHYGLDGTLLGQFGKEGTAPGEMIFPTDVCPDPADGTLWVCEYGLRSRVMHFGRDGSFINEWGSGEYAYTDLMRPMAVTVDSTGRVVVADAGNHRILAFDRQGKLLSSWGEAGEAPGQLKYPYDLAFAHDGTLYICEYGNSRVSHFTAEGAFLGVWGGPGYAPGRLYSPWGVATAPDGRVVVADTNNGRIQVIEDPARSFQTGGAT